jgi:hypothetical protein
VVETVRSKERSVAKHELAELFNGFLLVGAGEHE